MYAKVIDKLRKIVAIVFVLSGVGLICTCENFYNYPNLATIFGFVVVASLIATFGLVLEYIIRTLIDLRPDGLTKYQFTLREALIGMTGFAVVLSCYKILGVILWPLLIVYVLIVACVLEVSQRRARKAENKPLADPEAMSTDPDTASSGNTDRDQHESQ